MCVTHHSRELLELLGPRPERLERARRLERVERQRRAAVAPVPHADELAEEHIPRLTERFFRIDATRSRAKGGTGLGLAIVKHILVRHNSELRIKSKLNQGSTFFCDFVPVGPEHSATELNHEA